MLKIKQLRESKQLSQDGLILDLDKVGLRISRPTLASWENGDTSPRADELIKIAEYFKVKVDYLFKKGA